MTDRCIDAERIGDVLALAPDSPERKHVESCPRCRSLAQSYAMFMETDAVPGANVADADARLSQWRQNVIESAPAPAPKVRPGFLRSLLAGFMTRPALAAAALIVVAAAVVWLRVDHAPEQRLRGSSPASTEALSLSGARVSPTGSIDLSWSAQPQAQRYEVRIYAEDLTELARYHTAATEFTIPAGDIDTSAHVLLWRVVALANGNEIAVSAPGTIELQ